MRIGRKSFGCDVSDEMRVERTAEAHQHATDHEGLQAEPEGALAEGRSGYLVLPDGSQHPAPGAPHEPFQRQVDEAQQGRDDRQIGRIPGEVVGDGGQRLRDELEAERPAREPLCVEGHELQGDGDAEGGDGEIVVPQPQGRHADDQGGETRGDHGADPTNRDRQAEAADLVGIVGRREERRRIGADADEARHAHVEEAGEAPLKIEAERDDREDRSENQEKGAV